MFTDSLVRLFSSKKATTEVVTGVNAGTAVSSGGAGGLGPTASVGF
jgi:hypothetical protein